VDSFEKEDMLDLKSLEKEIGKTENELIEVQNKIKKMLKELEV
jgi:septal ring factor EnvC (AmiA/AmiB activator)